MSKQPFLSDNPAVNVLKRAGSSPLLLWAGIFQSAFLVAWIGFIVAFSNMIGLEAENAWQNSRVHISPEFAESSALVGRVFFSVVCSLPMIPVVLSLVGLWIHYASCRSVKSGGVSTAGLTIWKVKSYIRLVAVCSFAGISLIAIIAALAFSAFGGYDALGSQMPSSALAVLWFIYFLMIAGFSSLPVIGSALKIRLINRTKAVARMGYPDNRTPTFVVAVNYIKVAFLTLYGVSFVPLSILPATIPDEAAQGMPDFTFVMLLGVAMLSQAVYIVLVNISISHYKQEMTRLIYPQVWTIPAQPVPYAAPAAPVQPTAPAAPVQPVAPAQPTAPMEQVPEAAQEEKPEE